MVTLEKDKLWIVENKQSINEDKSTWYTLLTIPFKDKKVFQTFDLWLMNKRVEKKI